MIMLLKIILGVIVLGVLVLIHELGHFIAAKSCKIRVLAFSIGFGKVLLHKTVGETDYRLSAIPFGGYVKMAGEHPEDNRSDAPDEFPSKPIWQRAIVAVAGPLANFVSAMLMLWVMFMWGVQRPTYYDRPIVGAVADSSAARDAGLMAGDSIITMNNKRISSWNDIEDLFGMMDKRYEIAVSRDGAVERVVMETDQRRGEGYRIPPYGMELPIPAVVGRVIENMPAAAAGLRTGDTVVAIDGKKVEFWSQLTGLIQHGRGGTALQFTVARGPARITLPLTPKYDEKAKYFMVGIGPGWDKTHKVRFSPARAWRKCLDKTRDYTVMIFVFLKKLIKKELSWKLMSGPVGIIPASGAMAVMGISYLLNFMGMLGINLAVINLFPLIITDGGMLLFLLLEAIRRKPLSLKTQIIVTNAGVALFITLFLLITFNDITNLPDYFRMFLKGR
jgi:regulator of sigma E protease